MSRFDPVRGDRACGWTGQSRSEVIARNGAVATSQPLAAQAGLSVLMQGGNAFDAAVASAAALNVVEPHSAGIGGDAFCLGWCAREKALLALNGSGRSASGATPRHLAARGFRERMPLHGIESVTVPGAVDAWDALLKRAGSRSLADVLEPAVRLAEDGFGVTARISQEWRLAVPTLTRDPCSAATYLPNGQHPHTGTTFRNPELARALRLLQREGRSAFYDGEIADALVTTSRRLGGTITHDDLARTQATWVAPISTRYRGHDVWQIPPNTCGFAVLQMMNILEAAQIRWGIELARIGPRSPLFWHLLIEAKKLAYADLYEFNADPEASEIPIERLTDKAYAAKLSSRIDPKRASVPEPRGDIVGGTVYVAAADRWGNMVSLICSIYDSFGSGISVPDYGFVLNNRAALFSLEPRSSNLLAPRKRPFHTILPAMLTIDGCPHTAFGLMGGSQQVQGQAQVLVNLLDCSAELQAASDAARFNHSQRSNLVRLESALNSLVGGQLECLGHRIESADGELMGGFQAIRLDLHGFDTSRTDGSTAGPIQGVYRAASDHRKDGHAVGW